jgi:hypothetical protein
MRPRGPRERCGLCGAGLAEEHPHLVEAATRRLVCACEPCGVLFSSPGAEARYRRVPRDVRRIDGFRPSDEAWERLSIPIGLAFLLRTRPDGRPIALYPSPAGTLEAQVDPEAWEALADEYPALRGFEPDVEGLLVNRMNGACDAYRAGIDQCYRLVGVVRSRWRGFSGGPEVWDEIGRFFDGLKERSPHA